MKTLRFFECLFYFVRIHFRGHAPTVFLVFFLVSTICFLIFIEPVVLLSFFGCNFRRGNRHTSCKAMYPSIFRFQRIFPLYSLFPELLYLLFRVFHSFYRKSYFL